MEQRDKELLLKDLSARLPYGVKVKVECTAANGEKIEDEGVLNSIFINEFGTIYVCVDEVEYELEDIKPYLRPMSSMTEEEIYDLAAIMTQGLPHDIDAEQGYFKVTCKELIDGLDHDIEYDFYVRDVVDGIFGIKGYDWLNEKMFDFRGLIPKGHALSTEESDL